MLNTESFEQLFSEISEDLAEAINGGNNHNCHITHSSVAPTDFTHVLEDQAKGQSIVQGQSNQLAIY